MLKVLSLLKNTLQFVPTHVYEVPYQNVNVGLLNIISLYYAGLESYQYISRAGIFTMEILFPYFAKGEVVRGFGKGSKELGIPTANFPDSVVEQLPENFNCGVYYGWAQVNDGPVSKMVMSIGWNPYYKNTKKTMETHIMQEFSDDFYGGLLKMCVLGYIRPEKDFCSLDALIAEIKSDIKFATDQTDLPSMIVYKWDRFFSLTT